MPRRSSPHLSDRLSCPRQESNLHPALRRRVLYPLSYEGRTGAGYPERYSVEGPLMLSDRGTGMWFDAQMEDVEVRRDSLRGR